MTLSDEQTNDLVNKHINHETIDVKFNINGEDIKFKWPASDKECLPVILRDWIEHNEVLDKYSVHNGSVLIAGGNAGLYPFLHSLRFKKVYTFEPELLNFLCLVEN